MKNKEWKKNSRYLCTMLQLSELQQGNRFIGPVPPYNVNGECEVLSISDNEIVAKTPFGQTGINPVNADPIPLSEKWLKDHGFQIMKLNDASFTNGSVIFYLYAKPGEAGWYEDRNYTIKCDYVHHVQNAYKKASGQNFSLPALA